MGGSSFEELADVPDRLKALAGGIWEWSGPGIVLIAPGSAGATVVVLDQPSLAGPYPGVEGRVPDSDRTVTAAVTGWFEIIETEGSVDSWLQLSVNDAGRAVLDAHGLPERSPLLVPAGRAVCLAVDASGNHVEFPLRRMAGAPAVTRILPQSVEGGFFYRVYLSVVHWLIEQAETHPPHNTEVGSDRE